MIGIPRVSHNNQMDLFAPARDPYVAALVDRLRADDRMIMAQMRAEFNRDVLTRLRVRKLVTALRSAGVEVSV